MFKNLSFQEVLSIAYIIFIVIGVISESIFYGVLDVHYLEYTSILDALMSPFSLMTSDYKVFLILVGAMVFYYLYLVKLLPWIFKKTKKEKSLAKIQNKKTMYGAMLFTLMIIFPSLRIGMATSYHKKLKNKAFKSDYMLHFKNGDTLNVKKLGQNTSYIFYVQENEKVVTVTPISDNIKQIKRIPKEN